MIPTAAPARSLPCESCADAGYLIDFSISLIVISPVSLKSLSTIGSFSFLALPRIFLASSSVMPSSAAEDILRYHRAKEVDDRLMPIKEIITLIDEL